jgi:CRISPR/Cas system-associated exonuclease Cas4 (RecB family)
MRRTHSYSKRSVLETCMRKYFYEYYASDKRCPFDDDRREQIRALKKFSGCALLAGTIVHRMLALRFGKGRDFSQDWIVGTALNEFDTSIEFARDPAAHASRLNDRYPPDELVEFSFNDLDGEEEAARFRVKIERALNAYFESDAVRELRKTLAQFDEVRAESSLRGIKIDGWAIGGKIDVLAIRSDAARVIDWKLGGVERGVDSLQLYTYGRFAASEAEIETSQVTVQRVFLGDAVVEEPREVSETLTRRGQARLQQDIELMEELHEYGRQGDEELFTPCEREGICRRCQYRAICHGVPLSEKSNATCESLPVLETA